MRPLSLSVRRSAGHVKCSASIPCMSPMKENSSPLCRASMPGGLLLRCGDTRWEATLRSSARLFPIIPAWSFCNHALAANVSSPCFPASSCRGSVERICHVKIDLLGGCDAGQGVGETGRLPTARETVEGNDGALLSQLRLAVSWSRRLQPVRRFQAPPRFAHLRGSPGATHSV